MNAVERLWRGLARRDWDGVAAQFHPDATVFWPHMGTTLPVHEYVVVNRTFTGDWEVRVDRMIGERQAIAVEATVRRGGGHLCCAAFYDLHGGRISRATEYWFPRG